MQSEIRVRMRFGVIGDFCKPWAWNEDGGGGDCALLQGSKAGVIYRVSDGKVVGMDNQQLRIRRKTKALSNGLRLSEEPARESGQRHAERECAESHDVL